MKLCLNSIKKISTTNKIFEQLAELMHTCVLSIVQDRIGYTMPLCGHQAFGCEDPARHS